MTAGVTYAAAQDLFADHPPTDEGPEEGGSRVPPVFVYDSQITPQLADNKWQALQAGYPYLLNYNGAGSPDTAANRAAALSEHTGVVSVPPGLSLIVDRASPAGRTMYSSARCLNMDTQTLPFTSVRIRWRLDINESSRCLSKSRRGTWSY